MVAFFAQFVVVDTLSIVSQHLTSRLANRAATTAVVDIVLSKVCLKIFPKRTLRIFFVCLLRGRRQRRARSLCTCLTFFLVLVCFRRRKAIVCCASIGKCDISRCERVERIRFCYDIFFLAVLRPTADGEGGFRPNVLQ